MGTVEGAFVADQKRGTAAVVGEFLEDEGETVFDHGFGELGVNIFPAPDEFHLEQARFDGGEAAETPAGCGHGVDQLGFERRLRPEFFDISVEELLIVGQRFAGYHDSFRGEPVAHGVERGRGFAFRGGGTL